jgi:hypothetical protein
MTFSEDKLEQAVIEQLQAEGFRYLSGKELLKKPHEVYKEIFEQAENFKKYQAG